jgi:hypothetical protein
MTKNRKSKRPLDALGAEESSSSSRLGVTWEINVLGRVAGRDWCRRTINNVVGSDGKGPSKFNTCMGLRTVDDGNRRWMSLDGG